MDKIADGRFSYSTGRAFNIIAGIISSNVDIFRNLSYSVLSKWFSIDYNPACGHGIRALVCVTG